MAYHREDFLRRDEGFQQPDRVAILGEVPHWAMPAGIEHRVEILLTDTVETHRRGQPCVGICIGVETTRQVGLEIWLVTFWIERGFTTLWRCDHDSGARVRESVKGRYEFLKPKAG